MSKVLLKEPLLHFLIIGAALYWLMTSLEPVEDPRHIEVTPERLAEFMQFRTQAFVDNPEERVANMSVEARSALIEQYLTEEALYREAISLGLDSEDYVIKRRLIQKMEFLAEGAAMAPPEEADLTEYYEANLDDFLEPETMTFTHVFLSRDKHGEMAQRRAEELKTKLNVDQIEFTRAPEFGDQFAYHVNYVERTDEEVAAHFGSDFAQRLFELGSVSAGWQGPIESGFGSHLVLVSKRNPAQTPDYAAVREKVAARYRTEQFARARKESVAKILEGFDVTISPLLQQDSGT